MAGRCTVDRKSRADGAVLCHIQAPGCEAHVGPPKKVSERLLALLSARISSMSYSSGSQGVVCRPVGDPETFSGQVWDQSYLVSSAMVFSAHFTVFCLHRWALTRTKAVLPT